MGDFIVDFRDPHHRCDDGSVLRFCADMDVETIRRDDFTLFVSRVGSPELWSPFTAADGVLVALAGRIALDEDTWLAAEAIPGAGGLACKAIYQAYRSGGAERVARLSGSYAIHLHDPGDDRYLLVTDPAGGLPCYDASTGGGLLWGSHPDVLVDLRGAAADFDLTSLAEFIATGVVSFPHSYHRGITALDFGAIHRVALGAGDRARETSRVPVAAAEYPTSEAEHAERLADALRAASRRRTLPRLGRTAIALSGGLDSRTLLCAAEKHANLVTFCVFDERNAEFDLASAIARSEGVELIPLRRAYEHYADSAELGVRISGGMGELASNHFLGFRDRFRELGFDQILTGCYFDYLFKSLALDTRESRFLRREAFAPFSFETYLPHFSLASRFDGLVRERLEARFPAPLRESTTDAARREIADRRTFPLWQEGDNCQRLIPQRVMGWSSAAVDTDVLAVHRATPSDWKLGRRLFKRAVRRVCSPEVSRIPDANTGLRIDAPASLVTANRYRIALLRRLERRASQMATRESWPNWTYYIRSSPKLKELWQRANPTARELLHELTGDAANPEPGSYCDRPTQYFLRLLTVKLWLDLRAA